MANIRLDSTAKSQPKNINSDDLSNSAAMLVSEQHPLITKIDDTGTVTYIGYAVPGTATSAASWRIKRITNASGNVDWADSDLLFDNVFDNRAALSYG